MKKAGLTFILILALALSLGSGLAAQTLPRVVANEAGVRKTVQIFFQWLDRGRLDRCYYVLSPKRRKELKVAVGVRSDKAMISKLATYSRYLASESENAKRAFFHRVVSVTLEGNTATMYYAEDALSANNSPKLPGAKLRFQKGRWFISDIVTRKGRVQSPLLVFAEAVHDLRTLAEGKRLDRSRHRVSVTDAPANGRSKPKKKRRRSRAR